MLIDVRSLNTENGGEKRVSYSWDLARRFCFRATHDGLSKRRITRSQQIDIVLTPALELSLGDRAV